MNTGMFSGMPGGSSSGGIRIPYFLGKGIPTTPNANSLSFSGIPVFGSGNFPALTTADIVSLSGKGLIDIAAFNSNVGGVVRLIIDDVDVLQPVTTSGSSNTFILLGSLLVNNDGVSQGILPQPIYFERNCKINFKNNSAGTANMAVYARYELHK